MIDLKELRTGNIILDGDHLVEVDRLLFEEGDLRRYKYIPLTKSILDKNGLVMYEQDSDLFDMVCVKQHGKVLAVFSRPANMLYVHSLQNIIRDITGNELKIEL